MNLNIKSIILVGLFVVAWLGLVTLGENLYISTNSVYKINALAKAKIKQDIAVLNKVAQLNPNTIYGTSNLITYVTKEIGEKPSMPVLRFIHFYTDVNTRKAPRMVIISILMSFAFGGFWALILYGYYPFDWDRFKVLLWLGLLGGVTSTQLSSMSNTAIGDLFGTEYTKLDGSNPFTALLFVFIWGISEEIWKGLMTFILIRNSRLFRRPLDGMMMAGVVALGFAVFENIDYAHNYNISLLFLRNFLSVPAHIGFAFIWGWGLGHVKHVEKKELKFSSIFLYIFLAGLVHTTYNYYLTVSPLTERMLFYSFPFFLVFWHYFIKKVSREDAY